MAGPKPVFRRLPRAAAASKSSENEPETNGDDSGSFTEGDGSAVRLLTSAMSGSTSAAVEGASGEDLIRICGLFVGEDRTEEGPRIGGVGEVRRVP